jgi:hypothetical protein
MKRRDAVLLIVALATLATAGVALAQASAAFDLTWSAIAGGGGRSSSAHYTLNGTVGQSMTGPPVASSASYRVMAGFWSVADPVAVTPTATPPEPEHQLSLPLVLR